MKKTFFLFLFLPFFLMSCSHTSEDSSHLDQSSMPDVGDEIAVISTRFGDITLRFFPEAVPKTAENFITHAKNGYYDGVIFHRIIDGFMIQGGDPLGTGIGGESIWGGKFEDEFHPDLSNIRGSISMANAGANTNGSQFFINQAGNTFLDAYDETGALKNCADPRISCHSVFGQVIEGMDTVDAIAQAEKDTRDKPLEDIEMTVKIMNYEG
jgi:peptidyl-prolyl cis-trans isomerase B (cyclophilin B)